MATAAPTMQSSVGKSRLNARSVDVACIDFSKDVSDIRDTIPLLSATHAGHEGMICDVPCQLWYARSCQGYTCDEWIEWDAGKYTCESLAHDWGCACAGCKCKGKAQMTLNLFSEQKHPEARCLDGSIAGYYIRSGNEKEVCLQVTGISTVPGD